MAAWTAAHIPDLTGRTALVTGANSGLGLATAEALARKGALVVMACRDQSRCSAAASRIRERTPDARLETACLDLADLDSIRAFAEQAACRHDTIDILVNNAGVMAVPVRATTAQGFELQFGVNHLGHFALTGLLIPLLLRTPGSRIVTVSSFAHESGLIDFGDLQRERSYTPYGAYSSSKLANILFMLELDGRLRAAAIGSTASVGAHPGLARTNLQAAGPFLGASPLSAQLILAGTQVFGQSAKEGAEPQLYAATAPNVRGGEYFGPRFVVRGHPARSRMSRRARDEATAARLWEVSRDLTGVDIDAALGHRAG